MDDIISYNVDEYDLEYDHTTFSGENKEKFDTFEEAAKRMMYLKERGCFNFYFCHIKKDVYNISRVIESQEKAVSI